MAVSGSQAEVCFESFSKWDKFLSGPLATHSEVTRAAHWERAQSCEGSSVASGATAKLKF